MRSKLPRTSCPSAFHWFSTRDVTDDSLVADSSCGKATLHLSVAEGKQYQVGSFDMEGNRRFSREELLVYYPFGPLAPTGVRPDGVVQ